MVISRNDDISKSTWKRVGRELEALGNTIKLPTINENVQIVIWMTGQCQKFMNYDIQQPILSVTGLIHIWCIFLTIFTVFSWFQLEISWKIAEIQSEKRVWRTITAGSWGYCYNIDTYAILQSAEQFMMDFHALPVKRFFC